MSKNDQKKTTSSKRDHSFNTHQAQYSQQAQDVQSQTRRDILKGGLGGFLGLSVRSALLGIPSSFLMHQQVNAAEVNPKFTIFSGSASGEPINCNSPGTYTTNTNDLINVITHPNAAQIGNQVNDTINGVQVTGADLDSANQINLNLGSQTVKSARAYQALDQGFLNHFVSFWHQSGTNAHPEYDSVLEAHGALKSMRGIGSEQLPAAIAQENHAALGTMLNTPMVLAGKYTSEGVALNTYSPTLIKSLISGSNTISADPKQLNILYNDTLNRLYRIVKENGTPTQKRFLDQHLLSREQSLELGDNLNTLLGTVNNTQVGQMKTAIMLIKLNIAPVIVMNHNFGRDNHNDSQLVGETRNTFQALRSFDLYWKLMQEHNLTDRVLYTNMNVFGRTLYRNNSGGRDHFGLFTHSFLHGTHLSGGVVGSAVPYRALLKAGGINALTGKGNNPDIGESETLLALHASIMAAAGIPRDRVMARMPYGKVVESIFN